MSTNSGFCKRTELLGFWEPNSRNQTSYKCWMYCSVTRKSYNRDIRQWQLKLHMAIETNFHAQGFHTPFHSGGFPYYYSRFLRTRYIHVHVKISTLNLRAVSTFMKVYLYTISHRDNIHIYQSHFQTKAQLHICNLCCLLKSSV